MRGRMKRMLITQYHMRVNDTQEWHDKFDCYAPHCEQVFATLDMPPRKKGARKQLNNALARLPNIDIKGGCQLEMVELMERCMWQGRY